MIMRSDPHPPNPIEMIDFLIKSDNYQGKSKEALQEDKMLKIVASACNQPLEKIVEQTLKLLNRQ